MKSPLAIIFLTLVWVQLHGQTDSAASSEEWVGLVVAESMPEYVGGFEALQRYVNSMAIYTDEARKSGISGTVYVKFLVQSDGTVAEAEILRGLHADLDSVTLSLIQNMPKWIPAQQRGKPVACQYNLPIVFNAESQGNLNRPEPSEYWKKKGKKKFYKLCTREFAKTKMKCDCWYDFVIWNYNDREIHELNFQTIFDRQKCY